MYNINAMARALHYGLFAVGFIESIATILMFTKRSSTPASAYKRFKANAIHLEMCYLHAIKPETMSVYFGIE